MEEALKTTAPAQQPLSKETDDLLKTIIESVINAPKSASKDTKTQEQAEEEEEEETSQETIPQKEKEKEKEQKLGRPIGSHRENGIPQQPLQNFTPRHMDIIRRLVTGQTQREIAGEMGYTESRLSIIINSPLFQHKLKEYQKQVADKLAENIGNIDNRVRILQPKALDTLEELLEKKGNDRLRRDCAKDILDIGGNLGKKRDEDGMNDFARIISDAFKLALVANQVAPEAVMIDVTPIPEGVENAPEVVYEDSEEVLIGNS